MAQSAGRSAPRSCGCSSASQPEAATIAGLAGLTVIQDTCTKIEFGRLAGELAWPGINTRLISSRRGRGARMTDEH